MNRFKRSFSLVELLVVIAIISILASLLLPALERAKDAAYLASCINSQKQIALGYHGFSADHNGGLPLSASKKVSFVSGSYGAPWHWTMIHPEYGYIERWSEARNGYTTLNHFPMFYRCPSDSTVNENTPYVTHHPNTNAYVGYLPNDRMVGWGTRTQIQKITSPSEKYLMAEKHTDMVGWGGNDLRKAVSLRNYFGVPSHYFGYRHRQGGGMTMGFVDGHVEFVPFQILQLSTANNPAWVKDN